MMPKSKTTVIQAGAVTRGGTKRRTRIDQAKVRVERVESVMAAAQRLGLLSDRSSRIAGRVSPALVVAAKRRTGIKTDTDLIVLALAIVALKDNFAKAFEEADGKVDPKLELGYGTPSRTPKAYRPVVTDMSKPLVDPTKALSLAEDLADRKRK